METKTVLVNLLLALLLLSAAYLFIRTGELEKNLSDAYSQIGALKSENGALETEKAILQNDLAGTQVALNGKIAELEVKNGEIKGLESKLAATETAWNETKERLAEAEKNLGQTKQEFEDIAEEVQSLDQTLSDSISWFKANAVAPEQGNFSSVLTNIYYDGYISDVKRGCTETGTGQKTLNLACITFNMEKTLSITYQTDPDGGDRLYGIEDIIKREGGDCEDISLFVKATFNRIKAELAGKGYSVEAWKPAAGYQYIIFGKDDGDSYWYMPDATARYMGKLDELNPYVVCFSQEYNGHCIVALSLDRITGIEDVDKLGGSVLFEPQDGGYEGIVGINLLTCKEGDFGCEREINHISFIMTDDDLLQFKGGEWRSYEHYKEENAALAASIQQSLKSFD